MTVKEILDKARVELAMAGVESAGLDAMILLEAATGKTRSWLLAHSNDEMHISVFHDLLKRRIDREPISQIIGRKEFYGREFFVSEDVLTPRPETEILVEVALRYAKLPIYDCRLPIEEKPNRQSTIGNRKLLDLGTGSGCILLTLLLELPTATGTGIDASKKALAIATKNAYDLEVKTARFVHSNWCENLAERHFNLIVSNPPYVALADRAKLDAELDYEPEAALFGGDDGLECYRRIAAEISNLTFDFAIFEIGKDQEQQIKKIFGCYRMELIETVKDLAGINRVMVFKQQGK